MRSCVFVSLWLLPFALGHRRESSSPEMIGAYTYHEKLCHEVDAICNDGNKSPIASLSNTVHLTHCMPDPKDDRRGIFIFNKADSEVPGAHDVYRIRMLGHEILLPSLHACNGSAIVAPYKILIGGLYRVEILQVYDNFTFDTLPQPRSYHNMEIASFEIEVRTPDKDWGCAWDEDCPECSTSDAAGRWIVKDPRLLGEFKYCNVGFDFDAVNCSNPQGHSLSIRRNAIPDMSWQPYICKVVSAEDIDTERCLKDRKICIVGDSQMRHVQHGLTSLILKDTSYHIWDVDPDQGELISDKNQGSLEDVLFFTDVWGHPWSQHNFSECTDVLSNFGQWPASHGTGGGFWPAHQYKLAAHNHAEFLSSLSREGKRVFWVTTPSHAIDPGLTGRTDWRTDPLLSHYNRISKDVFDDNVTRIVDTFSITSPLNDLSYDGYHYKGLVAYNVDLRVLNAICPP